MKRQESVAKRLKASDEGQPFRKEPPAIISQSYSKNIQRASIIKQTRKLQQQQQTAAAKPPPEVAPEAQREPAKSNEPTLTTTTFRAVFKEPAILLTTTTTTKQTQAPTCQTKPEAPKATPQANSAFQAPAKASQAANSAQKELATAQLEPAESSPARVATSAKPTQVAAPSQSSPSPDQGQASPSSPTSTSSSGPGQPVNARLIDMGKKLLEAARQGQTDLVRQLVVSAGAPFTSDWLGTTALHLAAQNGFVEVAEILLAGGVNRDAKTKLERTALHCAAQSGSLAIVNLLLVHGSDVNACDMLKMTPLHWAAERGHLLVAERLLLGGADVSAINKFQLTPMQIAQRSESYEMIRLFQCAGSANNAAGDELVRLNFLNLTRSSPSSAESFGVNNFLNINFSTEDINFNESHDIITDELDYRLSFNHHQQSGTNSTNGSSRTSLNFDITEPCIDLVELEFDTLKFEPEFFLTNDEDDDEDGYEEGDEEEDEEEDGTKVEYLMKVVENLQKENKQLRQTVEHLQTTK